LHENSGVEFKSEFAGLKPGQFLKTLTAFANGRGGDLLIGVDDDRIIAPVARIDLEQAIEKISNAVDASTDPIVHGIGFRIVDVGEDRAVMVVRVPPSPSAPHMVTCDGQNRFYYRMGSSTMAMKAADVRAAYLTAFKRAGVVVLDTVNDRLATMPALEQRLLRHLAGGADAAADYGRWVQSDALEGWDVSARTLLDAATGLKEKGYARTREASREWTTSLTAKGYLLALLADDEAGTRAKLSRVHQALVQAPQGPADKILAHCLGQVSLEVVHAALECWDQRLLLKLQRVGGGLQHSRVIAPTQGLLNTKEEALLSTLGLP
jgi:hypothetical protein